VAIGGACRPFQQHVRDAARVQHPRVPAELARAERRVAARAVLHERKVRGAHVVPQTAVHSQAVHARCTSAVVVIVRQPPRLAQALAPAPGVEPGG
jgi:hypothetical protein